MELNLRKDIDITQIYLQRQRILLFRRRNRRHGW